MERYIVVYYGRGKVSKRQLNAIKAIPTLKIIDQSCPGVLIVLGEASIKKKVNRFRYWAAAEESRLIAP